MNPTIDFLDIISIVFVALGAFGFSSLKMFFEESSSEIGDLKLLKSNMKDRLLTQVLNILEDSVERAFRNFGDGDTFSPEYKPNRRRREANTITDDIWRETKKYLHLRQMYRAWVRWEAFGRQACFYAAVINRIVIFIIGALFLIQLQNIQNNIPFFIIAIIIVAFPLLILIVFKLGASMSKKKYNNQLHNF